MSDPAARNTTGKTAPGKAAPAKTAPGKNAASEKAAGAGNVPAGADGPLARLSAAGVAIWLDDISRARLVTGGLERLRARQHVVGVTSNPTIFANALAESDDYAGQLRDLSLRGIRADEATRMLMTYDVRWACDVMRPAYDASSGVDGRVSIEVDPQLAHETARTVAEAKALWWLVARDNLFVKIPATDASLPAITQTLAAGISVNVTLVFGLDRYVQVMDAFFAGLEQARSNGHDLTQIGSVASFFVSRVDTEVDRRLDVIATADARRLRGKAAIANAQLAYERYERAFDSDRWRVLARAGARPQRPLWASTSTKNPDYRDVMYVEQLVAPGVVNTMPEPTLHAFADHGEVTAGFDAATFGQAQDVLDRLEALGIDYGDVIATLEREGVDKFEASALEMHKSVETQLGEQR